MECKAVKLLEANIGEHVDDLWIGKDFFKRNQN
jgi:hypothetical protein